MLGKFRNTYHVNTARMSFALNRSSALERFERSNAIEICNRIMFDFYLGLSQVYTWERTILGSMCSTRLGFTS